MRHAIRIQPYLSPDLFRKLRAYAAARSLTVSAVVADALGEYLERDDVEDALLVRRMDSVTHAVEQLRRDVDTLAVGFGRFVRYSFFSAPATADAKVVHRAEALYRDFLAKVGEQLRAGVSFTRQVFPTYRSPAALAGAEEGGGEEGGRS
jgi:predicted transcriptional regulator